MNGFDLPVFNFFHSLSGKFWPIDWAWIFFAEYLPYFLVLAALYVVFREGGRKRIYYFALISLPVILSRGIITETIRFFYKRERPFSSLDFSPLVSADAFDSFPSGHAAFFFALAMSVYFINRKAGTWFFILVCLVAIGRVCAGIHWPLDILGGAVIGVICAFLARKALPKPEN
jgi:undecaprenyl-diphosphatase